MALSKFNLFIEDVLFNTLTGYAIKLNLWEIEKLRKGIVPEHLKDIIEEGFSAADEDLDEEIDKFLRKPVLEPTLVLTYNCNFDCIYCFQKGFRKNVSVSDKVIRGFVNYIRKNERGRKVRITYFGGEPLLQLRKIEEISRELSDLKYSFSVVTNGSLLTRKIAERLIPLGLTYAQITLDGPKEVHDERRFFVRGKGSFDVIVKNLKEVQDLIKVVLRINIDVKNLTEIEELLDELKREGINKVRLDPHLVHSNMFRNEWWDFTISSKAEGDVLVKFWETARKYGFEGPHDVFRLGFCVAYSNEDIVVDPEGNIYPCWAFTGNPLYVKGKLEEDGSVKVTNKSLWWKVKIEDKCKSCPYLPLCMGGCKFLSSINGDDCKREAYEKVVRLIRLVMD